MLRFGKISDIDPAKCYARVKFTDDEIVSDWLQIIVLGAISNQFFHIFDINEQVACLMDENSEEGVIIGAVFNDKKQPSVSSKDIVRVSFSDDSFIEYDRASHEYTIDVKGKINIKSEGETSIDAQTVSVDAESVSIQATNVDITAMSSITGNLTVSGSVTAASLSAPIIGAGGLSISGDNISTPGYITAAGEITSGIVPLSSHKHTGVTTGGGTSGTPIP